MTKLTTEEFIKKARKVHGDKYDYSKVEYVKWEAKVRIICRKHGEFLQSPKKHLSGQGCKKCHHAFLSKHFNLGKGNFVEKANAVHNGFYDYSAVEYVNSHTYVQIICPIHGAFPQDPASHLQGHGCPFCADVENGKRRRKWTYEKCQEEAKKYRTKSEFQKGNPAAYRFSRINGFLESFDWFEEIKKPNGYWTRERCEEESRKYHSKTEFVKGCSAAHHAAVVNGWLDDFDWLIDQRIDVVKGKIDSVYVYVFEDTKVAYVGRTLLRRQKKRDKEHIFNFEADKVARYALEHHVPVPPMKILESNLTLEEGLDREDYWRNWYEQQGYTMLNKSATGIGKGSLGGISHGKWNRKTCREEAMKYKSSSEFEVNSSGAYAAALRNGWLKEYTWFAVLKQEWTKQICFDEAKKYKTRGEFSTGSSGAYKKSLETGWIDEYTWLRSRQNKPSGYWDNYEHCYEEAKKYRNRRSFQKSCNGAYNKAFKNGWLDDYTWFEEMKKPNGFWNHDTCYEEAKKYKSKKEFRENANGAYQFAYKKGWLNDYIWLKPLTGYWTYETCKVEAAKYEKRSHFKKGCVGAYTKSRTSGWLDDFFPETK